MEEMINGFLNSQVSVIVSMCEAWEVCECKDAN